MIQHLHYHHMERIKMSIDHQFHHIEILVLVLIWAMERKAVKG